MLGGGQVNFLWVGTWEPPVDSPLNCLKTKEAVPSAGVAAFLGPCSMLHAVVGEHFLNISPAQQYTLLLAIFVCFVTTA